MTTGPAATDGRDAGEESLAEAFSSVARQLRHASQEILAPWDITPAHLRALRVLSHHGAMHMSGLSDRLHIAARSGTEVVDGSRAAAWSPGGPIPATGERRWSSSPSTAGQC